MTGYLLCASPRSGSTLLCDLLWQTRQAGKPNSFFRPGSIANYCDRFGLPRADARSFGQDYIDASIAEGRQGTPVFGLRTMWDSLPGLLDRLRQLHGPASDVTALERAFGSCKFIHLSRQDKLAQAVSYTMAEQTGLWHKNADGTDRENYSLAPEPVYDAKQISKYLQILEDDVAGWSSWFAKNSVSPLKITYEDVSANPIGVLEQVLSHLGIDPSVAHQLAPGTRKLGDQTNADWCARYRADMGAA